MQPRSWGCHGPRLSSVDGLVAIVIGIIRLMRDVRGQGRGAELLKQLEYGLFKFQDEQIVFTTENLCIERLGQTQHTASCG